MVAFLREREINFGIFDPNTLTLIDRISKSDVPILISGETGTGKEVLADIIIQKSGHQTVEKINCSAIPESLLESELFGHEKGSFTGAYKTKVGRFEQASGGTLFLDEIGDMDISLQTKLLRVLQDKLIRRIGGSKDIPCDVRIISATNKNLEKELKSKTFRIDLYYRLNVIPIVLPPLRGRQQHILELSGFFLQRFANIVQQDKTFAKSTITKLIQYDWPGNIRELRNIIERAVLVSGTDKTITPNHLLLNRSVLTSVEAEAEAEADDTLNLEILEKQAILKALRLSKWIQKDASILLGISPRALNYKINQHDITHPSWKVNTNGWKLSTL